MTTMHSAFYSFMNSFGVVAYPVDALPDDVAFPYLTYTFPTSSFLKGDTSATVHLWYYTESEKLINDKVAEIKSAIGRAGKFISCDEGYIKIRHGTPFAQSISDDTNRTVKGRYINLTLQFWME